MLRTQLARERAAAFGPAPAETIPLDELKGRIYFVNSASLKSKTEQTAAELCSSVMNGSIVGAAASGYSSMPRTVGAKSRRPIPNATENYNANENTLRKYCIKRSTHNTCIKYYINSGQML